MRSRTRPAMRDRRMPAATASAAARPRLTPRSATASLLLGAPLRFAPRWAKPIPLPLELVDAPAQRVVLGLELLDGLDEQPDEPGVVHVLEPFLGDDEVGKDRLDLVGDDPGVGGARLLAERRRGRFPLPGHTPEARELVEDRHR